MLKHLIIATALMGLAHAPPAQAEYWSGPNNTGFANFKITGTNEDLGVYYGYDPLTGRTTWQGVFCENSTTICEGKTFAARNGQALIGGAYRAPVLTMNVGDIEVRWGNALQGGLTPFDRELIGTLYLPWDTHLIQQLTRTVIEGSGPGPKPRNPLVNYHPNGWYVDPSALGSGWAFEWQGDSLFLSVFTYDSAGNDVWYISTGAMTSASLYAGSLLECSKATGSVVCSPLGQINLTFFLANSAFPDSHRIAVTLHTGQTITLQKYTR